MKSELKYQSLEEELAQFKEKKFNLATYLFGKSTKFGIDFYRNMLAITVLTSIVFITFLLITS